MKKIFSLILACIMMFSLSIPVFAASEEKTFSMITNTGIITLQAIEGLETDLIPDTDDFDDMIVSTVNSPIEITSVKLIVEGIRYTNTVVTNTYDFINYVDNNCTLKTNDNSGDYWKLNVYTESAPINQFLPTAYERILTMRIVATGYVETNDSEIYYNWGTHIFNTFEYPVFTIVRDFEYDTDVNGLLRELVASVRSFKYVTKQVKSDYAFIENTDENYDGVIVRNEILNLSYSSLGAGYGIPGFEGLTSQVVNFFNKKTNGKITFVLTDSNPIYSNNWIEGGIPSTQIGFRGTTYATNDIIGLFFNYEYTGSLMTPGAIVDGQITFDITKILNDINGNTAVISSIYYGLSGGKIYEDLGAMGFKVAQVILSTEVEETAIIEEVVPVVTDEVVTDDDDDEIDFVVEDDDEVEIVVDDDAVIDEEPDAVLIIDEIDEEDEDVNPKTGVALAIIPCVIAGAAVIITRKRK